MKKLLSLSLMLSLGLVTVTPALNAAQSQIVAQSQANSADVSGWQAAKKWWRSGRNMKALSKQEKKAFGVLKKKFALGAIITAIVAIVGGGAAYLRRRPVTPTTTPVVVPVVAPGYLEKELIDAAGEGNFEEVERLLGEGANVNAQYDYENTALMLAAAWGHKNIVERLLQVDGINVNATGPNRYTALMWAAEMGHEKIVERLLQVEGIDVNAADRYGDTALMHAAREGRRNIVKLLLQEGVDVNAGRHGNTVLMAAAREGRRNMVEDLLQAGADVNAQDEDGETALMKAAFPYRPKEEEERTHCFPIVLPQSHEGHAETVRLLLDEGAGKTIQNNDGQTAEDLARAAGNEDLANYIRDYVSGRTVKPAVTGRQKL